MASKASNGRNPYARNTHNPYAHDAPKSAPGFLYSPFMDRLRSVANSKGVRHLGRLSLAALISGATVEILSATDSPVDSQQRIEALKSVDTINKNKIVVSSGATYRVSPATLNPQDTDPISNVAGTVPKGHRLVITDGLESSTHPGWVAFTAPGTNTKDIHDLSSRAQHTVWMNVYNLEGQGYASVDSSKLVSNGAAGGESQGTQQFISGITPDGQVQFDTPQGPAIDTQAGTSVLQPAR